MSTGSIRAGTSDREAQRQEQPIRQFVGFRLANEDYAIAITMIREIILMKPITRLPQVPDSIEGLINLRGTVIPIINLRKRFGLPGRPFDDETRTMVVTIQDKTVGCTVDEVTQVMRIAADQVQPVPISIAAVARRYIAGLARLEAKLVIILDIEKLFGSDELDLNLATSPQSRLNPTPENPPESGA
jgi:purine-binding chemotaxis protein CheW